MGDLRSLVGVVCSNIPSFFLGKLGNSESYSGTGELPQLIIEARVYLKQGYFVVSHLGHNC